jgi:hypothetical protein
MPSVGPLITPKYNEPVWYLQANIGTACWLVLHANASQRRCRTYSSQVAKKKPEAMITSCRTDNQPVPICVIPRPITAPIYQQPTHQYQQDPKLVHRIDEVRMTTYWNSQTIATCWINRTSIGSNRTTSRWLVVRVSVRAIAARALVAVRHRHTMVKQFAQRRRCLCTTCLPAIEIVQQRIPLCRHRTRLLCDSNATHQQHLPTHHTMR